MAESNCGEEKIFLPSRHHHNVRDVCCETALIGNLQSSSE